MRFETQRYAMGNYAKGGDQAENEDRARGGGILQPTASKFVKVELITPQHSRFEREPDPFRTNLQRADYKKKSAGGELSRSAGDTKAKGGIEDSGKPMMKAAAKLGTTGGFKLKEKGKSKESAQEERGETAEQEREEEEC